jgi:Fe2+ transport system protein B
MLLALNMIDLAERDGVRLTPLLEQRLGILVVPTHATRNGRTALLSGSTK